MKRVLLVSGALLLMVAASATAARPLTSQRAARAIRHYARSPETTQLHVGRCTRLSAREFKCPTTFVDRGNAFSNRQVVEGTFRFSALVKMSQGSLLCTYDPAFFAWARC